MILCLIAYGVQMYKLVFYSMPLRLSLFIFFTSAFARCDDLPSKLISDLPPCSLNCVQSFVNEYYQPFLCPDTTDLECLCTHNTTSGFTLGEAALRCLVSQCNNALPFEASAYGICSGINGALPETHSTLTATVVAPTTVVPSSIPSTTTSKTTESSSISSSTNSATSALSTSTPTSISTSIISSSSESASTASSVPSLVSSPASNSASTSATTSVPTAAPQTTQGDTPSSSRPLATGQIVGVSVGVGAAFAFGLLGLLICLRRRRKKAEEEEKDWPVDNSNEHPLAPSSTYRPSNVFENATMVNANKEKDIQDVPVPPVGEKRRSFWRKSIKPEDIGVAVTPEINQDSPESAISKNTTSELLPEMPKFSLWPAPLQPSKNRPPQDKDIENTGGLDDDRSRPRIVSSRTGNGLPTDPRARMYALERQRSQSKVPLTPVYDNGIPFEWPRPPLRRNSRLQVPTGPRPPPTSIAEQNQPVEDGADGLAPNSRAPRVVSRASSQYSNMTESTNFEIDDYDYDRDSNGMALEPSAPEIQRTTMQFRSNPSALSPVAESPRYPPPLPYPQDDPFISPTRKPAKQGFPGSSSAYQWPRPAPNPQYRRPVNQAQPTIRVVEDSPSAKKRESPKDRLVAEGKSFITTDDTTPESEDLPTPPEQATNETGRKSPPKLLPPFRRQLQSNEGQIPIILPDQRPTTPDSLLAKRRGTETANTMLSQGLQIRPEEANRPRVGRQVQQQQPPPLPQQSNMQSPQSAAMASIWESIGRDRYEAASGAGGTGFRPPPIPRSTASSEDSRTAMVGLVAGEGVLENAQRSPGFLTRLTPTRRGNGDLFLRVG